MLKSRFDLDEYLLAGRGEYFSTFRIKKVGEIVVVYPLKWFLIMIKKNKLPGRFGDDFIVIKKSQVTA